MTLWVTFLMSPSSHSCLPGACGWRSCFARGYSRAPVVGVFFGWDAYAVSQGHWWFDPDRILGLYLPGAVPVDEIAFFIVIPIAAILTLEAVRSVRGWRAGDES